MDLLSLPVSAGVSDLDEMETRLRSSGWTAKPAPLADLDDAEREMGVKLLRKAPPPTKLIVDRFEWFWSENSLGRRWYLLRRTYGVGTVMCTGFHQEGLDEMIRRQRSHGLAIVQIADPKGRK